MKRQKFNDFVKRTGNGVHQGLGDLLTNEVSLAGTMAVAGAIALPLTYAHFACNSMYAEGIVDRMYSSEFSEMTIGMIQALPYQLSWLMILPASALLGAALAGRVGEQLDRI